MLKVKGYNFDPGSRGGCRAKKATLPGGSAPGSVAG
jgi:hypothetical protein